MSQHFLLSPAAKTLSLVKVMRMSHDEARDASAISALPIPTASHIALNVGAVKPMTLKPAKYTSAKAAQSSTA